MYFFSINSILRYSKVMELLKTKQSIREQVSKVKDLIKLET